MFEAYRIYVKWDIEMDQSYKNDKRKKFIFGPVAEMENAQAREQRYQSWISQCIKWISTEGWEAGDPGRRGFHTFKREMNYCVGLKKKGQSPWPFWVGSTAYLGIKVLYKNLLLGAF